MKRRSTYFFFQAEDGIRDYKVTGVQTCALPISSAARCWPRVRSPSRRSCQSSRPASGHRDRKSTRLNSSHLVISYAVFCLKKKKDEQDRPIEWLVGHAPDRHARVTYDVH